MSDILMGRWDCDACGAKGILGDRYECAACGSGRPEDVRFYLPEDAEEVTDAAGIAAAEGGADWQCEYCDSWLPAAATMCTQCGGGEEATGRKQAGQDYADRAAVPISGDRPRPGADPVVTAPAPAEGGAKKACGTVFALLLACCVFAMLGSCFLGWLRGQTELTVTGFSWERRVEVEVHKVVTESGWTQPADAWDVTSAQKVHHVDKVLVRTETRYRNESYQAQEGTKTETYTERVKTGTKKVKGKVKDLGNGRFKQTYKTVPVYKNVTKTRRVPRYVTKTRRVPYPHKVYRDEPRYQTHYTYKVKRWVQDQPLVTRGDDQTPHWAPEPTGEDRRARGKHGVYRVRFQDEDGERYLYELPEANWSQLLPHEIVELRDVERIRGAKRIE